MGRAPCCAKVGLMKGPWTAREDAVLKKYVENHGEGQWRSVPKKSGLLRCGKSCRLRWLNYLRPSIKRGNIGPDEEEIIIKLHALLGNRWALIAKRLPGRTDNEIKNYWNTHLSKTLKTRGIDPRTHKPLPLDGKIRIASPQDCGKHGSSRRPPEDSNTNGGIKVCRPKANRLVPSSLIVNFRSNLNQLRPRVQIQERELSTDTITANDTINVDMACVDASPSGEVENFFPLSQSFSWKEREPKMDFLTASEEYTNVGIQFTNAPFNVEEVPNSSPVNLPFSWTECEDEWVSDKDDVLQKMYEEFSGLINYDGRGDARESIDNYTREEEEEYCELFLSNDDNVHM